MELEDYLKNDIDTLYMKAGRMLELHENKLPDGRIKITEGMEFKSFDTYRDKIKEFLKNNAEKIKNIVCPRYDKTKNYLDDVSAVITSISSMWGFSTTLSTLIIAIIIKRGLNQLC